MRRRLRTRLPGAKASAALALLPPIAMLLLTALATTASARAADSDATPAEASATTPAAHGGREALRRPPSYLAVNGKAHTSMFGIEAEGYKMAYVIDRSASMGGSGATALKAAKAELLASLAELASTHRFAIVFYNEAARSFNPYSDAKTIFATERNKREAAQFVASIRPFDGTRHEEALREAIRQSPDVIYWLTDADNPKLEPAEIDRIAKMAAGITIHAIEFGSGPAPAADNFMARLAKATGGQHAYVDVTKLPPAK